MSSVVKKMEGSMEKDVFKKLAEHLDDLPGGFPSTASGVELRILRRIFTPEEAELALYLTLIPEESRVIARRAKIPKASAVDRLEQMARKGLIFSIHPPDGEPLYMALQYIIGIWEFHLNHLNTELIHDMDEYIPTLIKEAWKVPQLRTIPVGRSVTVRTEILAFEKAEELVRGQKKFGVAPCICRREQKMIGKGCQKPEETCLVFGFAADYYERNGLGRIINLQETLEILKMADEQGLVLQPSNSQEIMNICCCCGDCCGVLRSLSRFPKPASLVSTPFVASTDPDTCAGCGVCVERCQMGALSLMEEKAALNIDRCIGCGLCVSTCSTQSITLMRKPESDQPMIPKDAIKAAIRRGQERGKLSPVKLLGMHLKSKMDRLLAAR